MADPSQAPFVNTAEISADSGDDDDSTPDGDPANDPVIDIHLARRSRHRRQQCR
ncbi:MAG: hypothetical protein R2710_20145 [Acidimicrobiales bacterium]